MRAVDVKKRNKDLTPAERAAHKKAGTEPTEKNRELTPSERKTVMEELGDIYKGDESKEKKKASDKKPVRLRRKKKLDEDEFVSAEDSSKMIGSN